MEDLRWILLLVGIVVVAAIYLSGRFENDDWKRERKQFRDGKLRKSIQKAHKKVTPSVPASFVEKQEPSISSFTPFPSEPKPELGVDPKAATTVESTSAIPNEPMMEAAEPAEVVADQNAEERLPTSIDKATAKLEDEPTEVVVEEINTEIKPEEQQVASTEESAAESVETNDESTPNVGSSAPELQRKETEDESFELNIDSELEDEITDIEIPLDLEVAEAQIKIGETEAEQEHVQAEIPLDIEPLVLSVSIVAEDADGFSGDLLKEALETEGLAHGAMRIFHYYDPSKEDVVEHDDAVFSAANLLEPGYFELEKMADMHTPGLMLFCQLPGPLEGEAALELMLDKGRGLAVRLHGQMCDDKRNVFTAQAKTYYLDKVATFNREVELARKKVNT